MNQKIYTFLLLNQYKTQMFLHLIIFLVLNIFNMQSTQCMNWDPNVVPVLDPELVPYIQHIKTVSPTAGSLVERLHNGNYAGISQGRIIQLREQFEHGISGQIGHNMIEQDWNTLIAPHFSAFLSRCSYYAAHHPQN